MPVSEQFDYVIVGAGSAGSVLASRLAEERSATVCVLEAGPSDSNPLIHVPATAVYTLGNKNLDWMYKTQPSEGTAGRQINQARGKTLGGSGSINGHIYNRGHRMDFDGWAQMGNLGWSYADVLPYFKRSEGRIGPADDRFHGRDGPFTVTDIEQRDPLCDAFIEGAGSLGIPHNPDYNGAVQEGIAYAQRSIHRGRRVSSARAFLHPAMKRGIVDVKTRAHVRRINFAGKRATGITYQRDGNTHTVGVRGEVILCAGTFGSAQLLQISGIADASLLHDIGVPVVLDLPGVGENFCDHYGVRLTARVKDASTINERTRGWRLAREVARYAVTRSGALTLTPTLLYCFWKSNDVFERGDLQLTFTPASYPSGAWSGLDRFPGVTVNCWQQRPQSVGYVRACSSDPFVHPVIQPNYLALEADRDVLLAAMRLGRDILQSPPFKNYIAEERWPGTHPRSDDELLGFARENGSTCFHPIGTCRMGPQAQTNTVVDAELRVHGMQNLRVADASIMPSMPSANTNAGSLMIAEKAADMILGKSPLPAENYA